MHMQYVILDLEWNGAYSKRKKKYINEIIEFGAVKVDSTLQTIDTFSMLVKPQIGKKISGKVRELTHISNEELHNSRNTFLHVKRKFKKFSEGCVILTWGITDISTLMENNNYYLQTKKLDFLDVYMNLQSYCEYCLKKTNPGKQMGLSTAAELLNIDFGDDDLHRALEDSQLSYRCFEKLYNEEIIPQFLTKADKDFYDRIAFKNVMLTDIENPLLDIKELSVACNKCGRMAEQLDSWVVKNKSFRANFYCPSCDHHFGGRVQFKLKYDGVQVKRGVYEQKKSSAEKEQKAKEKQAEENEGLQRHKENASLPFKKKKKNSTKIKDSSKQGFRKKADRTEQSLL